MHTTSSGAESGRWRWIRIMKTHHHLSVQRQNFDLLKDIISICCGLLQEHDYLVCRVSEIWRLKLHALLTIIDVWVTNIIWLVWNSWVDVAETTTWAYNLNGLICIYGICFLFSLSTQVFVYLPSNFARIQNYLRGLIRAQFKNDRLASIIFQIGLTGDDGFTARAGMLETLFYPHGWC